jgi:sterol desaturase/sphingolipid hydroxylase (fatty acid hydroxylase superfamily)
MRSVTFQGPASSSWAMTHIQQFLGSVAAIATVMAVLALLETLVAFHPRSAWRRGHLAANLGLSATTLALNFVLGTAVTVGSDALHIRGLGLLSGHGLSTIVLVIGVVALDFSTYAAHWSMHRVPTFWRAHRVHHADPLVDVTTTLRQHPLEGVIRLAFIAVPALLLGLPAEALLFYRFLSVMNALLEHMDVKLWQPLDSTLSLVVTTPNMHKVHHSNRQIETDSNYGNILSVFDRIFRTFTPSRRAAAVEYGLDGYGAVEVQGFWALLRLPFQRKP